MNTKVKKGKKYFVVFPTISNGNTTDENIIEILKEKLGIVAGLPVSASSVAVIEAGEAEKEIASLGGE